MHKLSWLLPLLASALASAGSLSIQSAKLTVSSPDGEQLRTESLTLDKPPAPLRLGSGDVLRLAFTVTDKKSEKGVQPHQTFLRFFDDVSGEEGIQPVRVSSAGKAKFELNLSRPPPSLPPTTDDPLHVELLLGSFEHEPSKITLFDLVLPPSYPTPDHPDEVTYHPRPEIHHTFRPDPKSPPPFISAVFSGLVVAPWVLLLSLWSQIPHKLPHFLSLKIIPFVALLAAFEALLVWYWVALRLGQVLAFGAVLSLFTAAAGKRALSAVAVWRVGGK